MNEATVQRQIQKYLESEYPKAFIYKTHGNGFQKAGVPDICGCIKGRFVGIEVKLPGKEKTLTKLQQYRLDQINTAGGLAFMATSVEQVKERLKELG